MSAHPLLQAFLEVDCKARELMRRAGSSRQREDLRDAVADLRTNVLTVIAGEAGRGEVRLDVDTFKSIVRLHRELGIDWPDLVAAVNEVREGG